MAGSWGPPVSARIFFLPGRGSLGPGLANHTHTSLAMSALARTARIAAVLLLASKAGASEAPEPEPELALASERGLQGGRVGYNCASPTSCLL